MIISINQVSKCSGPQPSSSWPLIISNLQTSFSTTSLLILMRHQLKWSRNELKATRQLGDLRNWKIWHEVVEGRLWFWPYHNQNIISLHTEVLTLPSVDQHGNISSLQGLTGLSSLSPPPLVGPCKDTKDLLLSAMGSPSQFLWVWSQSVTGLGIRKTAKLLVKCLWRHHREQTLLTYKTFISHQQ